MNEGERFIPFQAFSGEADYIAVLTEMPLTRSQKRYLIALNSFAYKDGRCYPAQSTIGERMGSVGGKNGRSVTARQVRNIQRQLQDMGLIEVDSPPVWHRHVYGVNNNYFFIWSRMYEDALGLISSKTSAKISSKTSADAPYIKIRNSVNPKKQADAILSKDDEETKKAIMRVADRIVSEVSDTIPAHKIANYYFHRYFDAPPDALLVAMEQLEKRLKDEVRIMGVGCLERFNCWGYVESVLKSEVPKASARAEVVQARERARMVDRFMGACGLSALLAGKLRTV